VKYVTTYGGREVLVVIEDLDDGRFRVTAEGRVTVADVRPAGGSSLFSLLLGTESCEVSAIEKENGFRLTLRGATVDVGVESEQERNARALTKTEGPPRATTVKASMPGCVTKILVAPGDLVEKGRALLILEAMKMENEVRAEAAGVVAEIVAVAGRNVNGGDVLLKLKAAP
jgi:biotin carboxyl carrier protein